MIAAELQHGAEGVGGGNPADRLRGHREDDMSGELRHDPDRVGSDIFPGLG